MKHQAKSTLSTGILALLAGAFAFGCSSDSNTTSPVKPEGGAGGSGGTGGKSEAGKCTATVGKTSDDYTAIQTALENANSGDTICLSPGKYTLARSLKLAGAANITFRGTGATREDVSLDFSGQAPPPTGDGSVGDGGVSGSEGMLVETDGFTIENLWIKNSAGNGIKVSGSHSVFSNIKVGWDPGRSPGAYALYPTGATDTLMEDNEVYGAWDAGIYTGQCTHAIARRNNSHDNVLGIEIENTTDAEVYDNDVHGNVCGILLDLLPGLQKKTQGNYSVHDNHVYDNNLANNAIANSTAGGMPQGTGIMVLSSSDIEIRNNNIENNDGVAINVLSQDTWDIAAPLLSGSTYAPDPQTNRWPEKIYVHDNTFAHNGEDPQGVYLAVAPASDGGKKTIPYNVLWDGILKHQADGGLITPNDAAAQICLGTTEQGTFINYNAHSLATLLDPKSWSTDVTAHKCTLPTKPPLAP